MKRALLKLALWYIQNFSDDKTKHRILTLCVKKHFNTVSADDILKANTDGTIQFGVEKFDRTVLTELKNQAEFLEKMLLWKVIDKDVLYEVNKRMQELGAELQDMISAKVALWLFKEVIEKRLKRLRRIEN